MPSRELEGKVAVVTRSSRGIGKAIALRLAEAGANIVGNSVDPGKKKKVDETIGEIQSRSVNVKWIFGDVSTGRTRADLRAAAMDLAQEINGGYKVDYVFLNAAGGLETGKEDGWAEKMNVGTQLSLVERFRGVMNSGGTFVYETSLWAHYFGEAEQPPFYREVARTKHLAEKRLRELIPGLEAEGNRLGFLCGHIIPETSAYTLMVRNFSDYLKRVEPTAEGGHFPTPQDMGEAAVKFIQRNFKSGEIEYVGGNYFFPVDRKAIDAYTLSRSEIRRQLPMYGDSDLFVDSFESPAEDETGLNKMRGVGFYTVRPSRTRGHFSGKYKDIKVFKAVEEIEAAAQTLGLVLLGMEPTSGFVPYFAGLRGREGDETNFSKFVFPGNTIQMDARVTNTHARGVTGDVEIKIEDEGVSIVRGIQIGFIPGEEKARRLIRSQAEARERKIAQRR